MLRLTILTALIFAPASLFAAADEYTLRVECFELPALTAAQRLPASTHSVEIPRNVVEVRVENGIPFDVRVNVGGERIELRGVLNRKAGDKPGISVDLHYVHEFRERASGKVSLRTIPAKVEAQLDQRLNVADLVSRKVGQQERQPTLFLTVRKATAFKFDGVEKLTNRKHAAPPGERQRVRLTVHGRLNRPMKVQEIGLDDLKDLDHPKEPSDAEERLRAEIMASSGKPFQMLVQYGSSELAFAGIFCPAESGRKLDIATSIKDITLGVSQASNRGEIEPLITDKTEASSSISVDPGELLILGGGISATTTTLPNGVVQRLRSCTLYKVQVTEFSAN